jgi:hypothetical protein
MRRLLIAFALTCALSVTVLAGQIPTVGAPQPPPLTNSTGQIPTVGSTEQFTDVSLSAVLTVLSLLS